MGLSTTSPCPSAKSLSRYSLIDTDMVDQDNAGLQKPMLSDLIHSLFKTWRVPGVSVAVIDGEQSLTEVSMQSNDKS